MPLSPGTWLNHYEILGHLGTGGMGEVYRARDNKLQREVALKVLPKAFAQDPERLARFRREAQMLAQLNHVNIAAIYNLEQSGETHFLVMELALGETLRDRIKRSPEPSRAREQAVNPSRNREGAGVRDNAATVAGPVPLEEALEISKQIAAGLECAHEKPIVHRDLKPANIKVSSEGVVKILDFGLARAFAGDNASSDPSDSPTLSAMTAPGTILGTAAYMSPEQARGKKVDKRTDIWALGCVLYELLVGKQAFQGEDIPEILAAVMKGEPDWTALPETTPPHIRVVLRRCLEKDAKRRFHAATDVVIALEEAWSVPAPAPSPLSPPVPEPPVWRRAVPLHVAALVSIVALISVGLAVWNLRPAPAPQPVARFALTLPPPQRFSALGRHVAALSPDGTHLVYGANGQLHLRAMGELESTPIRGTEGGGRSPFFSPDGQWVGFWATDNALKKVSITGGAPVTLCEAGNPYGASWGPDDTIVFGQGPEGIWQVPGTGGTKQPLVTVDSTKGELAHGPQILPGGKALLFTVATTNNWDDAQIVIQDLATGERRVLIEGGTDARYLPTGHLVYVREGTLLAVPFDLQRLEVTGGPVPIVEDVMQTDGRQTGAAQFSFSGNGSLVYVPGTFSGAELTLAWVDRAGAVQPLSAPPRPYEHPRLSPDGQRLALVLREENIDLWTYDLARTTLTRLTFDPGEDETPVWMPDGKRLAFAADRNGVRKLLSKLADGTGTEEELLATPTGHRHADSWSPDGQLLAFEERVVGTGINSDIWVLPLNGDPSAGSPRLGSGQAGQGRKPKPFLQSPHAEQQAAFSPDGKWLAYRSDESGRGEVYVQAYPGPGGKWQISTDGGTEPVWARNGRELFYRSPVAPQPVVEKMMAVEIRTQPTFSPGTPRVLFGGEFEYLSWAANYDVSADGQRFIMIQAGEQDSAGQQQINVVLNWFEELKRRVPSGR